MKTSLFPRAIVLASLLAIVAACEGGGGTEASVAASMVGTAPPSQTAISGTAVVFAPAVRITGQNGEPMPGLVVNFAVAGGGGSVAVTTATTDASGVASAGTWTLGAGVGDNAVTASHGSLPPVHFLATAQPRVPTAISAASEAAQAGLSGTVAAHAPAVRVADQTGQPMANVTVRFAVTAGGGRVTFDAVGTDAQGVASAGPWTLGAAGQNTVVATVDGLPGASLTFTATVQPRAPAGMTVTSPTSQAAIAGTAVAQAPAVRVTDQTGEPLPGAAVTFAVTGGGGSLGATTVATDAAGLTSAGSWTLGATPGQNTVTATAAGLAPLTFMAQGQDPCSIVAPYTVGGTVPGAWTVTDCRTADFFRRDGYLVALTGEPVSIALTSASADARVVLYDADGRWAGSAVRFRDVDIPNPLRAVGPAGTYRLEATTAAAGQLGAYTLSSAAFDAATAECQRIFVVPNVTVAAALTSNDCPPHSRSDHYAVILHPGDRLTARMESTAFDAYLALGNDAGFIVQNDDGAGGTNALLTYTYTGSKPAQHVLYASAKTSSATGAYTLTVTRD